MLRRMTLCCIAFAAAIPCMAAPPLFLTTGQEGALGDRVPVVEGETVDFRIEAGDPDGDALLWSAEDLPQWLSLDPETGTLTGRAPLWPDDEDERNRQPGAYDITVSVTDGLWTVEKIVTVEVQDAGWPSMSLAELVAARPLETPSPFHTAVDLVDPTEERIHSNFGGGVDLRRICFGFTSQVPGVEGWEEDWVSDENCAYLPLETPAVQNAGAIVEGCYSAAFGDRDLGERVAAELGIPVLVIDQGWDWDHPSNLMGPYDQYAAETRDPTVLFYAFSSAHFIRSADALITVIGRFTDWEADFDDFRVAFTGFSKLGHTSFLTCGVDPGRVAGFLSAGAAGTDGNSGRLLGNLQGATGISPEAHQSYLGTMMRAFVLDRYAQDEADPETVVIRTLGTDDHKGDPSNYTPKYSLLSGSLLIDLPYRQGCLANAPHTTQTPINSTMWRMLLAHLFLGRPLGAVDSVSQRSTQDGLEINARLSGGTTISGVRLWSTVQDDLDISHWDGFVSQAMYEEDGVYRAIIAPDSTAYFVEVLDVANNVEGIFSSAPEPVDRDYPLLPIPPDEVRDFGGVLEGDLVKLHWTNPESADLAGMLIIADVSGANPGPLDGRVVYDGLDEFVEEAGPENGAPPAYYAFTYDGEGNYGDPVSLRLGIPPRRPSGRTRTGAKTVVIEVGGVDADQPLVRPLLGVISGPGQPLDSPAPDLTPMFQDIGVTTVRNNDYFDDRMDIEGIFNCGGSTYPSWEGCDPEDESNYEWGPSDELFSSWIDGGFEPFLRLGGEVQNAFPHHDFKGPQNESQERNWITAALKVVDRYSDWEGRGPAFAYLDIWTEFPTENFWDRSPEAFIRFWTRAFVSLKEAHPTLKIGGPGFVAGQTVKVAAGEDCVAVGFLRRLYENDVRPDWIGWHLFYNDPSMWYEAASAWRDLLDGRGAYSSVPWAGSSFFESVELIVDAYGVSHMDLPPVETDRIYNHGLGAAIRTSSWIAMQYSDVSRAYLYRSGDPKSNPEDDLDEIARANCTGLFWGNTEASYKPAAHAFRLWAQVVNEYPVLLETPLPPSKESGGLWTMAARNGEGEIALLLANPGGSAISWTAEVEGSPLGDPDVEVYQVDDDHDGRSPLTSATLPMTIPPESVQLVLLSR